MSAAAAKAPAPPAKAAFDVLVTDADPERAAATAEVLRGLADILGMDRASIDVRVDADSARLVRPHMARGALMDGVVRLDPAGFDPRGAGRYVLAHELTHLAQAANARPVAAPTLAASEAEAHAVALSILGGARQARVREGLPAGRAAFDVGAALANPAARRSEAGAEPAPPTLNQAVHANYQRELAAIRRLLDHWIITDGRVEQILRILQPLAFETATTLIGQLNSVERGHYIGNINAPHQRLYRREVLASYDALQPSELLRFDQELFEEMPLTPGSLTLPEAHAAVRALRGLPVPALEALDRSRNGPDIRALRTSALAPYDADAARLAQAAIENSRTAALDRARGNAEVRGLLERLRPLLAAGGSDNIRQALDELSGQRFSPERDPRFAAPVSAPTATSSTHEPPPLPPLALDLIIAQLDGEGLVERLIRGLPEADRYAPRYRNTFLMVLAHRRPDLNLNLARDLLSTGFFNWVWDDEAKLAYDILVQLPLAEQDRFRRLEDGELFERLYNELPEDFRNGPLFHGLEVARDANGRLIDAAARYNSMFRLQARYSQAVRDLVADFERGVTRDNALGLFNRLVALGRPAAERPDEPCLDLTADERLRPVVRHLDGRGLLQPMLDGLGDGVLQDRRYWNDLNAVLASRDPAMNTRRIRELLHSSFFDAVHHEEALLAFQIFRALPEGERAELAAAEDGALWGRLTRGLSRAMLQELGMAYGRTRTDASGENALRRRLSDPRVWTAATVRELNLLIAMEVSAGDFDWVFWQSRAQNAWRDRELAGVIERFQLYDERAGRLFPHPHIASAARDSGSWFCALFGTRAYELDFSSRAVPGADPFTGESTTWSELEGARLTVDLEQLEDTAGGPLISAYELRRSGGERIRIGGDNREQALAQPNVVDVELSANRGMARIRASRINLSRLAHIAPSWTVRTGAVTIENLDMEVRFADTDLRQPNGARLDAGLARADEVVATMGEAVYGAQSISLSDPHIDGAFDVRPLPDSPFLGVVFGLAWNLIYERAETTSRGMGLRSLVISFSDLRIEGLQTSGGLSVAAVSMEGAAVALGGNRAAYQRQLRMALAQRRARAQAAGDAATVASLTSRMADIDAALPELEARETELLALIQRMNQAGGVLPPQDEQRLLELQAADRVGGRGGLVADIGSLSVEGVDGPVRLRRAAVRDIRGEGETAALAFRQLTDRQAIEAFVRDGPPRTSRMATARADAGVRIGMGDIVLDDLVLPSAIPSSADLTARLDGLNQPPIGGDPNYGPLRRQLTDALALVSEYERLRGGGLTPDANGHFDRTPAERRRLNELSSQLQELFGLRVTNVTVNGPHLRIGPDASEPDGGNFGFGADVITATGITRLGLSIDRVEATGLRGGISFDQPAINALREPTRSLVRASGHADSLTVSGLRTGSGGRMDRLHMLDLNGAIAVQSDGILFSGLRIERIEVTGLDMPSTTSRLWSIGTTVLSGLTANVLVPFTPLAADAAPDTARGLMDADFTTFRIHSLHITAIDANQMGYEALSSGPGSLAKYRVAVESGRIGDIQLTEFNIAMPDGAPMRMDGSLDIGSFTKTRFAAAYQQTLNASGTLDRAAGPTPAVHVGFAQSGSMIVNLNRLEFSATDIDLPDRRSGRGVTITRTDLSAGLSIDDGTIGITGLHVGRMELSRIDWRTESGASITAHGTTVLENVDFSGSVNTLSETRSEYQIRELTVGRITATNLVYDDPPVRVTLRPQDAADPNAMEIRDIVVSNLLISRDGDRTTVGPTAGHREATIGVASSRFDFVADYARTLNVTGRLNANRIDVGLGPRGVVTARSRDLRLEADATYGSGATSGGGHVSIGSFDTGDIRYGDGTLSIGADGSDGLHIPSIETSALHFEDTDYKVEAAASGGSGRLALRGINVALDLNLHRSETERQTAGTPFRSLVMRRFDIQRVTATDLHVTLKSRGIHLVLPAERESSVGPISLLSPTEEGLTGQPFTVTPVRETVPASGATPATERVRYQLTGLVDIRNLALVRAQAQLASAFNVCTDLGAQRIRLGFLSTGALNVDLDNWTAAQIAGYVAGDPTQAIRIMGLGGEAIHYDSVTGIIRGTGTRIDEARYVNPGAGSRRITLSGHTDEDGAALPGLSLPGFSYNLATEQLDLEGMVLNGLRYQDNSFGGTQIDIRRISAEDSRAIAIQMAAAGGGQDIVIPRVRIDDATFRMNNLSGAVHTPPPAPRMAPPTMAAPPPIMPPRAPAPIRGESAAPPSAEATPTPAAPAPTTAPPVTGTAATDTPAAGDATPFIGANAADWIARNTNLFQALTGNLHVEGNIPELNIDWSPDFDFGDFDIDLPITNGEISYADLEDQLLDDLGRPFVGAADFRVDPFSPRLRLGVGVRAPIIPDPEDPHPDPDVPDFNDFYYWLVEWDLPGNELQRANAAEVMQLHRLVRAHSPTPVEPSSGPNQTVESLGRELQINNLDLSLNTTSTSDLPIRIDANTSMVLAGDGLRAFHLTGALQPASDGFGLHRADRPGQLQVGLGSLGVRSFHHTHALDGGGSAVVNTGAITITGVDQTTIDFIGWSPTLIKGHIASAEARDIHITVPHRPPAAPGAPVPYAPLDLEGNPITRGAR
ncbi:DUF4157 domain-containing protein [Caulobacter endophyticus]|uniref:DUF4157 domain-containing protein n=1 Tax=Caulobacter endophyticus TaxID=2172652 RepID=UPI00241094B7|nr:DUF4157 domain-containing protein [Caulobacter endophyticus]MDG2527883.1 DUF4157 domain-containing protein [Caulobacter endophyticus]